MSDEENKQETDAERHARLLAKVRADNEKRQSQVVRSTLDDAKPIFAAVPQTDQVLPQDTGKEPDLSDFAQQPGTPQQQKVQERNVQQYAPQRRQEDQQFSQGQQSNAMGNAVTRSPFQQQGGGDNTAAVLQQILTELQKQTQLLQGQSSSDGGGWV